jgi:hypothetical protein
MVLDAVPPRSELNTQNTFHRSSRAGWYDGKRKPISPRLPVVRESSCFACKQAELISFTWSEWVHRVSVSRLLVNACIPESFGGAENITQRKRTTLWRRRLTAACNSKQDETRNKV